MDVLTTPYIVVAMARKGPLTDGRISYEYIGGDLDVACRAIMEDGDYNLVYLIDPETDVIVWKQERGRDSVRSVSPSSTS